MKNAIIYTRVSTDEQAEKGFSLRHQKEQLENYCDLKSYRILNHFQEDYSAKNFSSRPAFNKLLRFVQSNKKKVDTLLFTKWDRFSRNIEAAYRMIRQFKEMGIEVNSIEQPLDLSQPDSKVMLAVYLVIPEVENDKNSLRTIDGLRKAMKEGCFTSKAPVGYINTRNEQGKSTLSLDIDKAHWVEKAFKLYASGTYSTEEVRQVLLKEGMKISRNGCIALLKNIIYTGKIYLKPYRKEEEMLVEGLHPAIIDQEIFDRVQLIMKGKWTPPFRSITEIDKALPLRGFLSCPKCGKKLTGSGSKGRGGKKTYFYYHCTRYCKTRHKAREVNALFERLLGQLNIQKDFKTIYQTILNQRFNEQYEDKQTKINSLHREKDKLINRLEVAEDHLFDKEIDIETFKTMKERIQTRLFEIKSELKNLQHRDRYFEKHLKEKISFLQNLNEVYENGSVEIKRKIIQTLFSEKLIYCENYFETKKIEETIQLILGRIKEIYLLRIKR